MVTTAVGSMAIPLLSILFLSVFLDPKAQEQSSEEEQEEEEEEPHFVINRAES